MKGTAKSCQVPHSVPVVSKNTNALKTHAPGRSGMILPGVRTAGLIGGGARHGRGTAAEPETGLDFAGEKSAC